MLFDMREFGSFAASVLLHCPWEHNSTLSLSSSYKCLTTSYLILLPAKEKQELCLDLFGGPSVVGGSFQSDKMNWGLPVPPCQEGKLKVLDKGTSRKQWCWTIQSGKVSIAGAHCTRGSEVAKAESKENWWEQMGNKMGESVVAYTFC